MRSLYLSTEGNGSVYNLRVFPVCVGDWIRVPRCFLKKDSLSMRSGTFFGLESPCGR